MLQNLARRHHQHPINKRPTRHMETTRKRGGRMTWSCIDCSDLSPSGEPTFVFQCEIASFWTHHEADVRMLWHLTVQDDDE